MSEAVATLNEVSTHLDLLYDWVLKSRGGLTREDAKRIFHRYRSGSGAPESPESPPSNQPSDPDRPLSLGEQQARKIDQIIGYMEQTTQRLDQIETDITYLKDKVDLILKKL